ncbi:MAG: ABC transporter permease [Burkholderiales bacterium]|nr:ABC transporter permease [Burkholderiales bacterium]
MPVVLWTDALLWLAVAAVAAYAAHARRKPHLAAPWRRVARSPAGMAAAVVLSAYVAVGLLDSLHYRPALARGDADGRTAYSVEVRSALDALLEPLRTRTEKTYSAPLATRSFARETLELADGRVQREFPRLRFGGAHLADEADRAADIALRAAGGVLAAAAVWAAVALAAARRIARRRASTVAAAWRAVWRGETELPWRAMLVTAGALLALAFPAAFLAAGYHVLGTDKVGQDVLYLALKSVRTALVIGGLTTLVMLPFAILLGISAGYFKGWVDDAIQYVYTTLNSIPAVLLIAAAVLMMQVYIDTHPELFPTAAQRADLRLLFLAVILGLTSWTGLARLLRGETLKLAELEYIQAARAFGVGDARIVTRHILPNVMHLVIVALVMDFSGLVLAEAVLSYVGVGVDPTMTSFGTMINAARLELAREPMVWWALAAAFGFMFTLVLAANLFADAVRDAFDPRTRVGGAPAPAAGTAR